MDNSQKKKKVAIVGVVSMVMVVAVIAVVGITTQGNNDQKSSPSSPSSSSGTASISTSTKSIQSICAPTDYRETCVQSLTNAAGNTSDPQKLVQAGFQVAIQALNDAISNSQTLKDIAKDHMASQAIEVCKTMMNESIIELQNSFDHVAQLDFTNIDEYLDDLKVWLSATIAYQQTCLDAFENTTSDAKQKIKGILTNSIMLTNNGLGMIDGLSSAYNDLSIAGVSRKLLEDTDSDSKSKFPAWISLGKRRLLEASVNPAKADIVVAKDGSGHFTTLKEAMLHIPNRSRKTFVVYVKDGVYNERVTIPRTMHHILLVGAGPTKTKITGDLSFASGVQPFNTATVCLQPSVVPTSWQRTSDLRTVLAQKATKL